MKYFDWDEYKNAQLKFDRGVSFEDVLTAVDEARVLDDIEHSNKSLYPSQRVLIVEINSYAYLVPYVEDETKIFFKTIIPSRKATRKYIRGESHG